MRRLRRRDEAGYAAVVVALLAGTVFMGAAALGVDTARWYVEAERLQRAADAAALAGVTYMPNDLAGAASAAQKVAARNGFSNGVNGAVVTAAPGERASQLEVTVSSTLPNTFGSVIGVGSATITRSSVADYTAPAPMGSPCNTFGNEPPSQPSPAVQPAGSALPSTPFPNCSSSPYFWGAVEGPNTDKVQGDRFMDYVCAANTTYRCSGGKNSEYRPEGYFWAVHVEKQAVNTPISVQLYDPAFIYTQINCNSLYPSTSLSDYMNSYTQNDGTNRYSAYQWTSNRTTVTNTNATKYCPGDYNPGATSTSSPPTTTFVLRHQNSTNNPRIATPISGCNKQFVGSSSPPTTDELSQWTNTARTSNNSAYDPQKAQLFHQWYELCTFTPDAAGDYYLQVRTNVSAGGTAVANVNAAAKTKTSLIYTNNPSATADAGNTTAGQGLNAFSMRAVPTNTTMAKYVAVAGNESMPILQNKDGSTAMFNLIRALPNTRGQYIAFDFFDPADGATSSGATVKVVAPTDATGSIKTNANIQSCQHARNDEALAATGTQCQVSVSGSTHNGQLEHMLIPIPTDYSCDPSTLGGCWFSVQLSFPSTVTDFTTWTANITGDPVRLIQ